MQTARVEAKGYAIDNGPGTNFTNEVLYLKHGYLRVSGAGLVS
jgi:hypothetical protein